MATVLESRKSAEPPKHEKFVEKQLSQAESRIRRLDVTVGVLGLVAGLLGFTLTVVVLDRLFDLSDGVRQGLLFTFVAIASVYAWFAVARPMRRRINPYYAAKQVEATLPEAKNSIVNYLDLKDEELSPAIKQAVGNRAAKDIREADIDEAIRGQHASRMSWLTGALFLAFVAVLIVLRPTQFFSLLGRAFSPFETRAIATRTTVKIVAPDGGNTTVILGQSVLVQVHVEGRIPDKQADDALTLRLKYDAADPETIDMPLEEGADNRTYQLRLPTKTVRNGFWYTVTGGDGTTPEYRVAVKSLPLFEGFAVAYDYPKYLRWEPQQTNKVGCQDPIQAMQGTTVTLTAHTNRTVREGRLLIDGDKEPIAGKLVAGSPQSLQFTFRLDRDANYRVFFTSNEGETNQDPKPYQLRVVSDLEPRIEWVAPPEEETSLPANDVLALEALATDDFGLDKMTLKMRVTEPFVAELEAKPYRAGKSFLREADQSYPRRIEYKDNVDLAKVKGSDAKPFLLAEGMLVEYSLEAIDNRKVVDAAGKDVLSANVGKSAVRRLRILPPKKDEPQKMEQKRQKLDQDKKKHEEKQDQQNKNEQRNPDQPEQEQPKENPQPENADPNAQKDPMKNGDPMMGDPMPMDMGDPGQPKPDKPMNMGEQGEPKPDQPMKGDQGDSKDDPEKKADQIENAIDKVAKEKGQEKPDNQDRKDEEREAPADQKGSGDMGMGMDKQDAGEPKGQPMPMGGQGGEQGEPKKKGELEKEPRKGQSKEQGEKQEGGEQGEPKEQPFGGEAGDKKEKGQPDKAPTDPKNMGGGNDPPMRNMGDPNDAQAKNEPGQKKGAGQKGAPKNEPGQPMDMNPPDQGNAGEKAPDAGQAKREPKPERGDAKQNGEPGEAGEPGQPPEAGKEPNAGQAKAEKPQPKGEAKAPPMGQQGQEAQAKNDGAGEQNGEPKSAPKPDPMKGQNQTAKGEPKPDNAAEPKKGDQGQGDAASQEQAKKEIEQLAKDLKSDDKATREAAERKLDDLKKQAAEAQKAQGNAGDKKEGDPMKGDGASEPKKGPPEGQDAQAAAPKGPPKQDGQPMGDQKADKGDPKAPEGQAKAPPMEKLGEGGEGKDNKNPEAGGNGKTAGKSGMGEPKQGEQGTAKANKPEPGKGNEPGKGDPMKNMGDPTVNNPMKNMGDPTDQKAENPEGADKPNPDQQAKGEPKGKNPGDGLGKWGNPEGTERTKPANGGDNPQVRRAEIDEAAKRRATDLQLEKLKANADNEELLKKMNMTKEEYRRFLDSYEKAVQRKQADAVVRDDQKTGPKTGATAANRGTRRVEGENATEGDVNRVGPVFAPSEFRNPFKEFTEELSKVKPVQK